MSYSQIAYQNDQIFWNKFFDLMFILESNKVIALWANENLTFPFYVIISNSIPNIATFVKEVFDSMFSLEFD